MLAVGPYYSAYLTLKQANLWSGEESRLITEDSRPFSGLVIHIKALDRSNGERD